jgi:hypothetical protein
MVAAAKDRKSGETMFNLVKAPSGTVMALVPLNELKTMPKVASKDMMLPQ